VRTTIDLPDDLYRALKARAALNGVSMRDLVRRLIEQGLQQPSALGHSLQRRREPPPVIVPPRGAPIAAVPNSELRRLEEEEDEARYAGSTGR
jgi:hypothetical protein